LGFWPDIAGGVNMTTFAPQGKETMLAAAAIPRKPPEWICSNCNFLAFPWLYPGDFQK
jgi:hypothetical protein